MLQRFSQGSIYDCLGFAVAWYVWRRTTDLPVRGIHCEDSGVVGLYEHEHVGRCRL